jgi:hypothetical protein
MQDLDVNSEAYRQLNRHVEACPRCQAERALMASFDATPTGEEVEAIAAITAKLGGKQAVRRQGWMERLSDWVGGGQRGLAWVGALAVLVAVGLYWNEGRNLGGPQFKEDAGVLRSSQVKLLAPMGSLRDIPSQFRWDSVTGAARYRIEVNGVDGSRIWESETTETNIVAPAGVLSRGRAYQWKVTAQDSSGKAISESFLQNIDIALAH